MSKNLFFSKKSASTDRPIKQVTESLRFIFFIKISTDRLAAIEVLETELRNEEEKRRQLIEVSHDDR